LFFNVSMGRNCPRTRFISGLNKGMYKEEYLGEIKELMRKGLALKSKHYTGAYLKNENDNETIDFILENLK